MGLKHDLFLSRRPLAGFLAIGFSWAVYFAQMPVIKANVGASDAQYGLALLMASLGAIAAMWLAPLCQRVLGGLAVPLGIAALAAGMLWAGASYSLPMLICAMLLASAGSGVVDVLINARTSEIEHESGRGLMNLNHALYSFAYAAGALVTAVFRGAAVGPLPIFAGLCVVLALLAVVSRQPAGAGVPEPALTSTRFPSGLVVLTGLIVMIAFLTEAATEGWSALHLERTLDGAPAIGALGPAMLGLTMGIGRMFGHGLSRHIRDTTLMLLAVLMSAVGVALAGMAPTVAYALVGFGIAGLGISVVVPLAMSLIGRVVPPEQRLAAISRATAIGFGAFFFGPSMMGLVAEGFGLRVAFYMIAVLLIGVAAVLIPALARRAT